MQSTSDRIYRLEKEARRMKGLLGVLIGLMGIVFLTGPSSADGGQKPVKVVSAQEFVLKDADGKVHARWYIRRGGPTLTLYHDGGKHEAVELWAEQRGRVGIMVAAKDGWAGGLWDATPYRSGIGFTDAKGQLIWKSP